MEKVSYEPLKSLYKGDMDIDAINIFILGRSPAAN